MESDSKNSSGDRSGDCNCDCSCSCRLQRANIAELQLDAEYRVERESKPSLGEKVKALTLTLAEVLPFGARSPFVALKHRNYRIFFVGQFISLLGNWMQTVAQGWLVLELTNRALHLGVVGAAAMPASVLFIFAGTLADRISKRRILLITQSSAMLLALLLAILVMTNWVRFWHVLLIAVLMGAVTAFDIPTRQSFIVEMVGKRDLMSAIALHSSMFNASRMIGPAIAGAVLSAWGMPVCFFLNAFSYLAIIISYSRLQVVEEHNGNDNGSFWHQVVEGMGYIRRNRVIRTIMVMLALTSIFGMSYIVLMPVFARDVLGVGARGLGLLMSAAGAGALVGALNLASLNDRLHKGRVLFGGMILFAIMLSCFSQSRSFPLSLICLFFGAFGMVSSLATANTLVQTLVPDELRGRVMGVYTLMLAGMAPLGSLQAGAVANLMGAPYAVLLGATMLGLSSLTILTFLPRMRRLA